MKEGVSNKDITIIPMGVDLSRFKPKKEKRKDNTHTILFVGRLVPEKGILDLIEAYLRIKKKNLRLKIVGDGPLKGEIEKRLNQEVLSCDYLEIHRLYQEADIMVIPSKTLPTWEEQYGMVAVEAMASGLSVVAYRSGALPLVLSKGALWVKEGNVAELAQVIKSLVDNSQLRSKLGTIARRLAEVQYDCIGVKNQYKKLYEDLSGRSYQK
jgi:glycosyltransferase involved in cell wall biosynthesis